MEENHRTSPGETPGTQHVPAPTEESELELFEDDEEFLWLAGASPLASAPQADRDDIEEVTRHAGDAPRVEDDAGADDEAAAAGRAARFLARATGTVERLTDGGDDRAHDRSMTLRPRPPGVAGAL